jgi:hypothetical protein
VAGEAPAANGAMPLRYFEAHEAICARRLAAGDEGLDPGTHDGDRRRVPMRPLAPDAQCLLTAFAATRLVPREWRVSEPAGPGDVTTSVGRLARGR